MSNNFTKRKDEKINIIFAHSHILKIFLQTNLIALKNDPALLADIESVSKKLPPCYSVNQSLKGFQPFLTSQTFISVMSEFDLYLVDTMSEVIEKYPNKLGSELFKLSEILEVESTSEIIRIAADRYINSIMYKRAFEYKKALLEILSADENLLANQWPIYVEAKARRDLGVHNGWENNETYARKVKEAGLTPETAQYLIPDPDYFYKILSTLIEMANEIEKHCTNKFCQSSEKPQITT